MNKLRIITLTTSAIALLLGYLLLPPKKADESPILKRIAPSAVFSAKQGSPPRYESDGMIAFNTHDVVPHIRGYAGPIKLLVGLDGRGIITGIEMIGHEETKNYVHYMETPEYLNRFIGKSVFDPMTPDVDIDAISRATVSVDALARTVRESTRIMAQESFGIAADKSETAGGLDKKTIAFISLFAVAFALYFITRRSRRYSFARDIVLVLSIAVLGVWLLSPFSVLHVYNIVLGGLPGGTLQKVFVLSIVLSVIFAGRFYCGWLCPFGAISEFIGRLKVRKWGISETLDDKSRVVKYIIFIAVTAIVLFFRKPDYGNFEAYVTLFSMYGNAFAYALCAFALIANLRVRRFWCRVLCPVGALTGLSSRREKGYVSSASCPVDNPSMPDTSECIRCNRCYTNERR